jgi:hypothetical protein
MDAFEMNEQTQPTRKISSLIWNVLTVLVLLMVVCLVGGFLLILMNPSSQLNLFPPPTLPATISFPTATATSQYVLPATWTPAPTLEPTLTDTPAPSSTPAPTETPFSLFTLTPTTVSGTDEAPAEFPFIVGPGTPVGTSSLAFHPEAGCDWMGVAGQVFDLSGAPVSGQQVRVGGTLLGAPIDMLSLTGLTTAYGNNGFYEFTLGEKPVISTGTLWVQLIDQSGLPMSDKIYFDTYDACDKNLIFVNFKQVR